jgi:cytochrome c556
MKVRGLDQYLSHSRRRMAIAISVLAAGFLAPDLVAMGQDQSAATAKDVIWARKTLMASIGDNADRISYMISERNIDLHDAHEHARNISVMLMAFPHLFPPSSNQWKEGADLDPATDTIASPDIWTDFAYFYKLASGVAKIADDMRRADNEEEVKSLNRALGINCDLCHALFLKE